MTVKTSRLIIFLIILGTLFLNGCQTVGHKSIRRIMNPWHAYYLDAAFCDETQEL